jgi:molecular chaperone DnaK
MAMRDVQDLLEQDDPQQLEMGVSGLQEALFGLNRRLSAERSSDAGPLQGIRSTLGTLKDELFADDDWDDDPWSTGVSRSDERMRSGRRGLDPWDDDFYR